MISGIIGFILGGLIGFMGMAVIAYSRDDRDA